MPKPFHHNDQSELFKLIRLGKLRFDSKYWKGISGEAIRLIMNLLEVDPTSRFTASHALESDWIKSIERAEQAKSLASHTLKNSLPGISKESNRLKNLVKSVQWLNRDKHISSLTVDSVVDLDLDD